jgi:RNA polymerase sigma factor (TIGR02999 family)
MTTPPRSPVTQLLTATNGGDAGAQDRLWSLIYDELRKLAQHQMAGEASGHTLQPTALVHEAYFRLFGENPVQWSNRGHFFTAAAEAMRRIRVDDARRRGRLKRGGGQQPSSITDDPSGFNQDPVEVLAVGESLEELEQTAPRQAEVVKLRYFTGLTGDECAAVLEVSPRTVDKDWAFARAWLHRKLSDGDIKTNESESDEA